MFAVSMRRKEEKFAVSLLMRKSYLCKMISRRSMKHSSNCLENRRPFSFKEFLKLKQAYPQQKDLYSTVGKSNLKKLFDEYLTIGVFPRYISPNTNYLSTLYVLTIS